MNGHMDVEPTAALLFIRSRADSGFALEQVNAFLALRRDRNPARGDDKILAVCFRRDLDSGLPPLLTTGSPNRSLGVFESFSVAGIWTLSWLGGPAFRGARPGFQHSYEQREAVLRNLAPALTERDSHGGFCPVFSPDEPPEFEAAEARRLRNLYPELVGFVNFRQDASRGVQQSPGPDTFQFSGGPTGGDCSKSSS